MDPVTFCIPLVSRRVARDWASTERLLSTTLSSVFNQDDPDIHVIIACHETPKIAEVADPRVTVVNASFDIPRFRWEMEIDRMRKLELLGATLRARGGGLQYVLDGDDYVGNSLARQVRAAGTKAVVVQRGYRLDARNGLYQDVNKIWGKCGSCIAVRWEVDELPETPLVDHPPVYHEFCENRHYALPKFFREQGWSITYLNEPLVTYVVNHGSNQSEVITRDNLRWRLYFRLMRRRVWSPLLDNRFGVNSDSRSQGVYSGKSLYSTQFGGK